MQKQLIEIYNSQNSIIIADRNNLEIFIAPNQKGYQARYLEEVSSRFKELLIKKEDKYFYHHIGFNPWSSVLAALDYVGIGHRRASSTISQQLVKILLQNESERTLKNKMIELFYALSLEIYQPKEKILTMYINSIYFGNQAQGLSQASHLYFNLPPSLLTDGQTLQLLAAIHSPSQNNPAEAKNKEEIFYLAERLNLDEQKLITTDSFKVRENIKENYHPDESFFEIQPLINLTGNQQLTIDKQLTEKAREIIKTNIEQLSPKNVNQAAAIIIKLPENEILSLIGSPDPRSFVEGNQINMLVKPRPIGSTIKPFIYLKAFEKDLRPYTSVEDREYKYITALGFPLYPKNFDYKYRGTVTLHYALSNSLNVPAVKVLEYVGLEEFYNFLEKDLDFEPVQDLDNYQLGIALGALEMNLTDLSHYFTIFPNNGILKELKIQSVTPSSSEQKIAEPQYVQLINKILNDRITGIEQFGLKSDLNLFQKNYALKTGTSRDFRDSWVIGYTPDFLVGVWVGNANNEPMDEVSGQAGAGKIWAQIMELLLNSEYNKKTPFDFNLIREFENNNSLEYGLLADDYETIQNALLEKDSSLILRPHDGDVFFLEKDTKIILEAKEDVDWFINEDFFQRGIKTVFTPQKADIFEITAKKENHKEQITIFVTE